MKSQAKDQQTAKPMYEELLASTLTPDDIKALKRREKIKAELAELDKTLKPKITRTIDELGEGEHEIGNVVVKLARSTRMSVSWKDLAYAELDEAVIENLMPRHTQPHIIDSAKIL
jgi:hypothetical protein